MCYKKCEQYKQCSHIFIKKHFKGLHVKLEKCNLQKKEDNKLSDEDKKLKKGKISE